jgi:Skp family chaperone for outer membrane proteins
MRILAFIMMASILLSGAFVPQARAAAGGSPSIALVDVEKILSDSKASKSLQGQIKSKREAFQKEFSAKEKELKATETTLVSEKEKLSAEEFAKKRKAYEEKILETRKLFQKRRNGLDTGINKAMGELRQAVVDAASAIAEEKKYDIVLTRDSVLIADKVLDITPDVLKKLDSIKSDVKLSVE